MDFESPDVAKDFPGLYEAAKKSTSRDSDYSDEEKASRKDLLGKRKEKKDKGYVAFEGESSEDEVDDTRSPGKIKKNRPTFTFPRKDKREKKEKGKEKDVKEKKEEDKDVKCCKKEVKDSRKETKDAKMRYKEDKKKESKLLKKYKKKKTSDQFSEEKPIFGIPLQDAIEQNKSHDGIEIPVIVRECIDYIEEHGLSCEGIYRISGVKSKVRQLKSLYNRHEKVYLYEHEPQVVASLLKQFLRDLPEPILTAELTPKFEDAATIKNSSKRAESLLKLIESLPDCNRLLLSWIIVHMLHVVQFEKRNKMNIQNVSILLSNTLQISQRVLHAFFSQHDILFEDVEIKKYVPPIEPDSSRLSLELPDSPTALQNELYKQEALLNVIHEELSTGLRDAEKEEKLWEVQRVITQLKRKLRFMQQVRQGFKQNDVEYTQKNEEKCDANYVTKVFYPKLDVEQSLVTHKLDGESSGILIASKINTDFENANCHEVTADINGEKAEIEESVDDDSLRVKSESNRLEQKSESPVAVLESCKKKSSESPVETTHNDQSCSDPATSNELKSLQHERTVLFIEEEEKLLLADELRRKISSEKKEIERLHQEIAEAENFFMYLIYPILGYENSSTDTEESDSSSSNGEDCEDPAEILKDLLLKNEHLQKLNKDLSQNIQHEREACLELKVRMNLAQLESQYTQM